MKPVDVLIVTRATQTINQGCNLDNFLYWIYKRLTKVFFKKISPEKEGTKRGRKSSSMTLFKQTKD